MHQSVARLNHLGDRASPGEVADFYALAGGGWTDAASFEQRFAWRMNTAITNSLDELSVADAMHPGLVSCPPETSLRALARLLATHRVHAIVVFPRHEQDAGHVSSWKVISDLGLVQAACELDLDAATVADIAGDNVRCVQPDESLMTAVRTMLAGRTSHVIVVDRRHGRPLGILSTLDVARALAGYVWPADEI